MRHSRGAEGIADGCAVERAARLVRSASRVKNLCGHAILDGANFGFETARSGTGSSGGSCKLQGTLLDTQRSRCNFPGFLRLSGPFSPRNFVALRGLSQGGVAPFRRVENEASPLERGPDGEQREDKVPDARRGGWDRVFGGRFTSQRVLERLFPDPGKPCRFQLRCGLSIIIARQAPAL
jgi:hypothetical protein